MRLLTSASLALLSAALAGPAQGADLMEIYRMAQASDATYAGARAAWSAGQERLPQGLSGLLPSVSISADTQATDRETRSRDASVPPVDSRFNSNSASVSVTQPVYRPQNMVTYQQAKAQVVQADAVFAQATQDLILRVAQAYLDVLLAQDTIAFAQAQLVAIGRQLEQAKRNFEVGTATITDAHEAQSRYDLTVSLEITARNDLEIRKRFLELIIGRPAPGLAPLGPRFVPGQPEPSHPAVWVADAAYNNLQVRVAQANLEFSTREIERNRAGHLPTVDAFARYTDAGNSTGVQSLSG